MISFRTGAGEEGRLSTIFLATPPYDGMFLLAVDYLASSDK